MYRSLASFSHCQMLLLQGKVYIACVWSCMLHGSETWSSKRENIPALHRAELQMISGWMCDVKLVDKISYVELRHQLAI